MSEAFDPYRKWLGIPPKDQPPNHYRLLGIAHFEDDPDVIENAAARQMSHVRTFQSGKHSAESQRILNELTSAKLCLLQAEKKAVYDTQLRQHLAALGQLSTDEPVEAAVQAEPALPPPPPDDFRTGNRWRTGTDIDPPMPSVGPPPVPIPMPQPPAKPVIVVPNVAPVVRRTSSVRGKRSSSGAPVALILGSVGVLAFAVIVAVVLALQNKEPSKDSPRNKTSVADKSSERQPPKTSVAGSTNFPIGGQPRPRPNGGAVSRTEPVVNRTPNLNPAPPAALGEPADELKKARDALARRHDGDFTLHVSQAEYLIGQKKPANADELKDEVTHLREINKLLSDFWQAVRDGADKKIPKGERFKFRKHEFELVSREGDQLTYKVDGREEVAAIKKLPARVASSIAYRTLGNENLNGKISLVVFLTTDADAASDAASRRLAAKLYDDIHKAGEENHPVLVRELGANPQPMPNAEDDFSPPVVVGGGTPTSSDSATSGKPDNSAKPAFDATRLKEARERFDRRFRERYLLALEREELARPLYTELLEAAEGDETLESKSYLLNQAAELAAQLGDSNAIVMVSELLNKITAEDPLEFQNRVLGRCSLEGANAAKDLLKNAKTASQAAEKAGNLYVAIELMKTARRAAEKTNMPSEVFAVDERIKDLQSLQDMARTDRK